MIQLLLYKAQIFGSFKRCSEYAFGTLMGKLCKRWYKLIKYVLSVHISILMKWVCDEYFWFSNLFYKFWIVSSFWILEFCNREKKLKRPKFIKSVKWKKYLKIFEEEIVWWICKEYCFIILQIMNTMSFYLDTRIQSEKLMQRMF